MKYQTYHKQNKLQKGLISFIQMFKNDKRAILRAEQKGLIIYTPKLNKVRVGLSVGLFGLLCITPFTPQVLLIPKLTQFALK